MTYTSTHGEKVTPKIPLVYLPFRNSKWEGYYEQLISFKGSDNTLDYSKKALKAWNNAPYATGGLTVKTSATLNTDQFSGFVKVEYESNTTPNYCFLLNTVFAGGGRLYFQLDGRTNEIGFYNGSSYFIVGSFEFDTPLSLGVSGDAGEVVAYVNGTAVHTSTISSIISDTISTCEINTANNAIPQVLYINDFTLFDSKLLASEMAQLHAGTYPLEIPPSGAYTEHTHVEADITDLDKYTQAQVDSLLAGKSDVGHTHTTANITDYTESTQDLVGAMVSGNTETGISVTYDDVNGKLDFVVNSSSGLSYLTAGKAANWSPAVSYTNDYVDAWDYTVTDGSGDISLNTATGAITLQPGVYELSASAETYYGSSSYYIKLSFLMVAGTITNYIEHKMVSKPGTSLSYATNTITRIFKVTATATVYLCGYTNSGGNVRLQETVLNIKKIA